MAITTKQFQKFSDLDLVWDFLVDIYEYKKDYGVAAPFFEHAIKASWMDSSYSFLDRLWFDGDKVVAFVFVVSVVPKPGIVYPNTARRDHPRTSAVLTATSKASVESSPPETPITIERAPHVTSLCFNADT